MPAPRRLAVAEAPAPRRQPRSVLAAAALGLLATFLLHKRRR
jgi:hypothetical protein